jgi:hypothetical protein
LLTHHCAQRTAEPRWLAHDLAEETLPRPAGWAREPLSPDPNPPALPPVPVDPDLLLADMQRMDLAALETLVSIPSAAALLTEAQRNQLLDAAAGLALARLRRWGLAWLRVAYALAPAQAAPEILELLLDAGDWRAALAFLDLHDDPALRAYAACRISVSSLKRAGREAWLASRTDDLGAGPTDPSALTRAEAARQLGALGAALTDRRPLPAGVSPLAILQRFPYWPEAMRLVVLSAAQAGATPEQLVGMHMRLRAQFGIDPELCRRLGQVATEGTREALARDAAAMVLQNPRCARAWEALCQLGPRDDFDVVDFALTHL